MITQKLLCGVYETKNADWCRRFLGLISNCFSEKFASVKQNGGHLKFFILSIFGELVRRVFLSGKYLLYCGTLLCFCNIWMLKLKRTHLITAHLCISWGPLEFELKLIYLKRLGSVMDWRKLILEQQPFCNSHSPTWCAVLCYNVTSSLCFSWPGMKNGQMHFSEFNLQMISSLSYMYMSCNSHMYELYPFCIILSFFVNTAQKRTIHQVTTMLATSKNVLFQVHNHHANHRYWWPDTLIITRAPVHEGSSISVVSRWLWPGNRIYLEVASMVVTWWIVAFLRSVSRNRYM